MIGFGSRFRNAGHAIGESGRRARGTGTRLAVAPLLMFGQVSYGGPSSAGMPGANFLQKLLGWVAQGSLWACLGAMFIGGALWGYSQHHGNAPGAAKGKQYVLGGAIGAAVIGGAVLIINTVYSAATA